MKPKISLLVLSYNGGRRVIPTLESCKLQTYKNELIISDDASTDNGETVRIIEDWLSENEVHFERVEFIKNSVNKGIVRNFRDAALRATGEVIFGQGQRDLIYGPETIERVADEIERQRLSGLADPYIWLGHFRSFSFVNGNKINKKFWQCSQPEHFELIEKSPDKALKKLMAGNFIGGPSAIYNVNYFGEGVFPIPENIKFIEDYPSFVWMLVNKNRFGFIREFIHWYENGVGICHKPNPKMVSDWVSIGEWLMEIEPSIATEYAKRIAFNQEYRVRCKTRWQRMTRHPIIFSKNVARFIWNKFIELSDIKDRWIPKVAESSSPSFGDELFAPENYPPKPEGIF